MRAFDLIIVGGGLVGAGLALALQHLPLKIALIDARLPSSNDERLFGLTSTSCQFLTRIGLWPHIAASATPIRAVHISQRGYFGALRLKAKEIGQNNLGHVLPAKILEAALHSALAATSCTLYRPAELISINQEADGARLVLCMNQQEISLHAPIVIAADGTHSTVRKQFNLATEEFDYAKKALVTKIRLERDHHFIAYERFYQDGVLAMLPLADKHCATIVTVTNDCADHLLQLSETDFLAYIQDRIGYRLGRLLNCSPAHVYPVHAVFAKKMQQGSVLLLGNAAHTLHPIAAQGFNLALYEVTCLLDAIEKKHKARQPFSMEDLAALPAEMRMQQQTSIFTSHHLARIFSERSWLSSMGLQCGMMGLDTVLPLKRAFMQRMLGKKTQSATGLL
jgi:2-octaprenyl-6-methoxyphenol hydroxylase